MVPVESTRISIRASLLLAITTQVIYFPVVVYIHAGTSAPLSVLLVPALMGAVFNAIFIFVADRVFERFEITKRRRFPVESQMPGIVLSILLSIVATILAHYFYAIVLHIVYDLPAISDPSSDIPASDYKLFAYMQRVNTGVTFIILLSISYIIFNRRVTASMKSLEIRSQQLVNQNTIAQFEALKSQVNPQFLFNSFNSLQSLMRVNPDAASEFVSKLSTSYRYVFEQKENDLIPLKTELDFIRSYTSLVQMVSLQRVEMEVTVFDDTAVRYSIAPLTLQLLFDEATQNPGTLTNVPLEIRIGVEGEYLIFERTVLGSVPFPHVFHRDRLESITGRYKLLSAKPVIVIDKEKRLIVKIPLVS